MKQFRGIFVILFFVHTLVLRKNEAHLEQQCPRLPSQALSPTWYAMHSQYNVKALIKEWAEFESASRSSPASTALNSQPAFTCLYIYSLIWKKNHLILVYCKMSPIIRSFLVWTLEYMFKGHFFFVNTLVSQVFYCG